MVDYHKKWDKVKIGNVKFINSRKDHSCRNEFVEYIIDNNITLILEVGPGELIEGKTLLDKNPDISYSIMDVSDTFLNYCKSIPNISAYKGDMIDAPFTDKQFDLVYMSSVLEHSPDIKATIKEMSRISNEFYFTMFKWSEKEGGLESIYRHKKKYYSTPFNIDMLIELISEYGKIEDIFISSLNGDNSHLDFEEYRDGRDIEGLHRTGDYLTMRGKWKVE
jgi:ubiquinone/menaquinone biosynthesis C-methylase UbiE